MDEILEILRKEIIQIVRSEISKFMKENKYEKPYDGVIVSINDDETINVDVKALGKTLTLKNKTGEILTDNDSVIVYARGGNINNSYIGIKY